MNYLETREVYDTREANRLLDAGWKLEEVRTLSRWSRGHFSETTSYLVGLPVDAIRDVAAVSLSL